jgi:ABC-type Fe3+/spermidine/putrescine transport system ATPase subunit
MSQMLAQPGKTSADAAAAARADAAGHPSALPMVRLEHVSKTFAGQSAKAVADLSLDVMEGEIFALLGPSGCGKTTTLRMVAGLEDPDQGAIYFKDRPVVVTSRRLIVPPEKRQVGMVFQSYAIWPHMTVEQNVAYPLRLRRLPAPVIRDKVARVLALVGLADLGARSAMHLSGGQQQRVALARALVYEPGVLLLDEPFSNLDTKLRDQMRYEVKLLQSKLKLTVLFVTHDQVEALSLSTRLAVMDHGRIQQIGAPRDLYEHPANEFVRDFLGRAIVLRGRVEEVGAAGASVLLNGADAPMFVDAAACPPGLCAGAEICLSSRPEDIELAPPLAQGRNVVARARIITALFVGERVELKLAVPEQGVLSAFCHRHSRFAEGDEVSLSMSAGASSLWLARPAAATS